MYLHMFNMQLPSHMLHTTPLPPHPPSLPPANLSTENNGLITRNKPSQKILCRNGSNHGNCMQR